MGTLSGDSSNVLQLIVDSYGVSVQGHHILSPWAAQREQQGAGGFLLILKEQSPSQHTDLTQGCPKESCAL